MLMETKTKKEGVIELPGAYYGPAGYAGWEERQRVNRLVHGEGSQPGFDGNPVEKMDARDIESRDRMTGRIIRETPAGPENINHSRIRHMHVRKRLTDRQAAAGNRYHDDWQLSQAQVLATAGVLPGSGFARSTLADARLDAMTRWGDAKASLNWREREIVWLIVIENRLLEVAASMLKIHHQRAAERLECGLDALADHYGLGT